MTDFLKYFEIEIKPESNLDLNSNTNSTTSQLNALCGDRHRMTIDLRNEFVAGIQHYFNLVIGSHLLYKFERLQYAELLKRHTDRKMSDLYGPSHLLRLFSMQIFDLFILVLY